MVRVHRDAVTRVGQQFLGGVLDRGMGHEELKVGIAEWKTTTWHPGKKVHAKIVNFTSRYPLENVQPIPDALGLY